MCQKDWNAEKIGPFCTTYPCREVLFDLYYIIIAYYYLKKSKEKHV